MFENNKDFFPTPVDLIDKMLSKIERNNYNHILEPSVWKWDIIDRVNEKCYWRKPKWYWIELDYNLRELSKNKCEIIWYDFLDFNPWMISINCIIANFPFSNWDKHFLKAWEILKDWEMVCLVNAETIKNPFSKSRQLIQKIIADNNWEVEYIENAFIDAERKTWVEVAMISIKKKSDESENMFSWFKQEFFNEYKDLDWEIKDNQMVVWNDKIDHLVNLSKILKNIEVEKQKSMVKAKYYNSLLVKNLKDIWIDDWYFKTDEVFDITDRIFAINQRFWSLFFQATNFRSQLTAKTYENFISEYSQSKIDFTRDNINKVMDIIKFNSWKIQEENILTIFDYLTKHRSENREHIEWWKTNSWWKLRNRWIVPYWVELDWGWCIRWFTYNFKETLDDIDKVFCFIWQKDFNKIKRTRDWFEDDCEFFEIKVYKKWTVHFKVKDEYLDILKTFNYKACASKKWLWL